VQPPTKLIMQYKYRDYRDGLADILEALYNGSAVDSKGGADGDVGITRLMFVTQISWAGLLPFIEELVRKEMITSQIVRGRWGNGSRKHRVFSITQKGIRFLVLYKKLKGFLEK
jgi:predicted transcriptional regulator